MANREIDDVYNRINAKDSYKNRKFDGKRTIKDDYTGEIIYYGNKKDAKRLHSLERTADIDHITPIDKVKQRYGDLSIEQQKKLANNEKYNYAVTNSKLNRNGKNALENHEYIKKELGNVVENLKNGEISESLEKTKKLSKQSTKMIGAEVKSRIGMAAEATKMRAENAIEKINPAISDSIEKIKNITLNNEDNITKDKNQNELFTVIPIAVEAVNTLIRVSSGEEELTYILTDKTKEFGRKLVEDSTKDIVLKGKDIVLDKLKKKGHETALKIAEGAIIGDVVILVKESAIRYINGEINEKEFVDEVKEKGLVMMAGSIGAVAGAVLIPIPVAGEMIGSFIVSTVCVELYKAYNDLKQEYKNIDKYKQRESEFNKLCYEALMEIRRQQDKLKKIIIEQGKQFDETVNNSFECIYNGTMTNDVEQISEGLQCILEIFSGNVKFKTYEEFDDFFMNDQCELKL